MNDELTRLKGELTRLGFSKTARLFVSQGLPQLFREVLISSTGTAQPEWLFLPVEQINRLKLAIPCESVNQNTGCMAEEPFASDELDLFPIFIAGEMVAILLQQSDSDHRISRDISEALVRAVTDFDCCRRRGDEGVFGSYITSLFGTNLSAEAFSKQSLGFLIRQAQGATGGLYCDAGDGYRLRFIVGTLSDYDLLPGQLLGQTRQKWMSAIRRGEHFVSAELLPDHAALLSEPPRFLFVHPGMQSETNSSIYALILGGDASFRSLRNLKRAAVLTAQLHESQFVNSSDRASLYKSLMDMESRSRSLEDVMLAAYKILSRGAQVSRLSLVLPDGRARYVCTSESGAEYAACYLRLVDESVFECLKSRSHYIDTRELVAHPGDVHAEMYIPVRSQERLRAVVAIGCPADSDTLLKNGKFLSEVADFIGDRFLRENSGVSCACGESSFEKEMTATVLRRLNTIGQLAEADFHDTRSHLSVIMGQTEVIEKVMSDDGYGVADNTDHIASGLGRICKAAGSIGEYLDKLSSVCSCSDDLFEREVPVAAAVEQLPGMLAGPLRQLKETRGITLEIAASSTGCVRSSISWSAIYDCLLPLILGLIETADRSGEIRVEMHGQNETADMIIDFNSELIGGKTVKELIGRAFPQHRSEDLEKSNLTTFAIYQIKLDEAGGGRQRIKFCRADTTKDPSHRSSQSLDTEMSR